MNIMKPHGLVNSSSLCYFNSIIQAFFSLPKLIDMLLLNESKYISNRVAIEFIKLIKKNKNTDTSILNGYPVFVEFKKSLDLKYPEKKFGNGQEDSGEFMTLFLDILDDSDIYTMFTHRYNAIIWCSNCEQIISKKTEQGIIINISSQFTKGIDSFNLNNHLKNYTSELSGYICSHCKFQIPHRIYILGRAPDIITVLFNKFEDKYIVNYPKKIYFDGKDNKQINYKLMSNIEHFGGSNGGHYISHGIREFNEYSFNDTNVNKELSESTVNTYLLFYHIY